MERYDDDRLTPNELLGKHLRSHREAAGLGLRELADRIKMPFGYLGRVERGEQQASEKLVVILDEFFGTRGLFADLLEMAQQHEVVPGYGRDFLRKERDAIYIQVFTSSHVPGLLQTEDYAREFFRAGLPGAPQPEVDQQVAVRMRRQRIFQRAEPPYYHAIVDEAALRRPTTSRKAMRAQLGRMVHAGDKPRNSVQVLPFGRGLHSMPGGSLTMLTLKDGTRMAQVDSFGSGLLVDSPKVIARQQKRFDTACAMALPEDESRNLIRSYLKEYEDDCDS